jgi:hypothetical protein
MTSGIGFLRIRQKSEKNLIKSLQLLKAIAWQSMMWLSKQAGIGMEMAHWHFDSLMHVEISFEKLSMTIAKKTTVGLNGPNTTLLLIFEANRAAKPLPFWFLRKYGLVVDSTHEQL